MKLKLDNKERIILKILIEDKLAGYTDYGEREIPLYQVLLDLREKLTKLGAE